jgi:hypothetical protein
MGDLQDEVQVHPGQHGTAAHQPRHFQDAADAGEQAGQLQQGAAGEGQDGLGVDDAAGEPPFRLVRIGFLRPLDDAADFAFAEPQEEIEELLGEQPLRAGSGELGVLDSLMGLAGSRKVLFGGSGFLPRQGSAARDLVAVQKCS